MTTERTKRFVRIASSNAPYHPYWGGNGYFIYGYMFLDTPYYQREEGVLPPSHYTYCAVHSPVDNHILQLGEIVTVMGLDQNDLDVQVDFIQALWLTPDYDDPSFGGLFAGNMANGYWTGIPGRGGTWTEYTHVDGGVDQGVTEEVHYANWFHSNCHKIPDGLYNPPAPSIAHFVRFPMIFGRSPDFHVNGRLGLYDCRAVDIPSDSRYKIIPNGPITLTIMATHNIATGADISVGGQPVPLDVTATVQVPAGLITESPVGNMPAAYLVTKDISENLGVGAGPFSSGPAVSFSIANSQYDPDGGVLAQGQSVSVSDPGRSAEVTFTVETIGEVPGIDPDRGPPIAFSPAPPGQTIQITGAAYNTNVFTINNVVVAQVDTTRAPAYVISAPPEGQTISVSVTATGELFVVGVTGQTEVDGTVTAFALNGFPEEPDVVLDCPVAEPTEDPTETPSEEEMSAGYQGEAEVEGSYGDTTNGGQGGGGEWGSGSGEFDGSGGGSSGGNGTGGDGADSEGGEGAE